MARRPAVHERFMRALKDEAGSRRIAVVARRCRTTGCAAICATHPEGGATAISWAWDVYDAGQRRAFRLKGEDKAAGAAGWATADDEVLRRIARSALDQLAGFAGGATSGGCRAGRRARASRQRRAHSTLGWFDDWAPEKPESSAFSAMTRPRPRRSRRCPSSLQPGTVPMPRGRPSSDLAPPSQALAYASAGN